ncbi:MAG: YncE family protein [Acidobacteria bacterium]|nr:YncE family protein [Acidobacteriota bacterium]
MRFLTALSVLFILSTCNRAVGPPEPVAQSAAWDPVPGMPPILDPKDIYSAGRPGMLSEKVKQHLSRVYVPNNVTNVIDVIDPETFKIVDSFPVEREPQHVTPSWDLRWLWVGADQGNTLTKIDPVTGKKVATLKIEDPYNLYFTPDGKYAIVVAERLRRLDFREPDSMKLIQQVTVPCKGVDHMDFSADGRYAIATCEFSGEMIKVDTVNRKYLSKITLPNGGMPQDVKLSPDGKVFYIADMQNHGMHVLDGDAFQVTGFIPTGKGCHGLYISRDSKVMYVSNRNEGTVSVFNLATRQVEKKWAIPGGGTPDMGGLSADGKTLWLSGRYSREVYAFNTETGELRARIKVHRGPHGLCVWPQPGRYSVGHTGILR